MIKNRVIVLTCPCCGKKIEIEYYAIKQVYEDVKDWAADQLVVITAPIR